MDVTFITERFPPDRGGMARSAERITGMLRRRGHSVRIIHLTGMPGSGSGAFDGDRVLRAGRDRRESLFFDLRDSLRDSVLVGFGGGMPGILATLWGGWLSRPSVVLFRGNDLDRLAQDERSGWMFPFVCDHAGAVGAVTTDMVRRIAAFRKGPVGFTPCGIDLPSWRLFPADRRKAARIRQRRALTGFVVGMIGQLKRKKGLRLASQVFGGRALAADATVLTIGELDAEARAMLSGACGDRWVAVPWRPPGTMPVWYAVCDAVFIPSLFDGMPNVLLEAMASGVPVVASRAGGMPDVIDDGVNGLLFDPGDAAGAAAALRKLVDFSDGERQRMIGSAREAVASRFTPECEAEAIESLIDRARAGVTP